MQTKESSVVALLLLAQVCVATVGNVHLALTGDPTKMAVSWLSYDSGDAIVRYGTQQDDLNQYVHATYNYYGEEGQYGFNYYAVMIDLTPSTTYFYTCTRSNEGNASFTTQPSAASPFKVAVYADMGVENSQQNAYALNQRVVNKQFDFAWHIGDISYANKYEGQYELVWNTWFEMVQNFSSLVPYMVSVGNHEYSCNKHDNCYEEIANFTAYRYKFNMPYEQSGGVNNLYYSYDYGLAHFVSISSENGYPGSPHSDDDDDTEQIDWLIQDLEKANNNRANVPWIIVGCHRPMYTALSASDSPTDPNVAPEIQDAFEKIINQYKVNFFLSGHKHHYERQWPVYDNVTLSHSYTPPQSAVHIVSGAGGDIEGLSGFDDPLPDFNAVAYNANYGYGILDVASADSATWTFYTDTDQVVDTVTVTNWATQSDEDKLDDDEIAI